MMESDAKMATQPRRDNIASAFDSVDGQLEGLDELVDRLDQRLQPILHRDIDEQADPSAKPMMEDNRSDVYQWAQSRAERIRRIRNRLAATLERVDL